MNSTAIIDVVILLLFRVSYSNNNYQHMVNMNYESWLYDFNCKFYALIFLTYSGKKLHVNLMCLRRYIYTKLHVWDKSRPFI